MAIVRGITSGHTPVDEQVDAEPYEGTRAGDQLYALHTATGGDFDELIEPSPGDWKLLDSTSGGSESLHTKLWRTTLVTVPEQVTCGQGFADGTLHLVTVAGASAALPKIVKQSDNGGATIFLPGDAPGTPSGIELRFAGAFVNNDDSPVWKAPAGYPGVASAYSGEFATSAVTFKAFSSSAPLADVVFTLTGADIGLAHGYTIIIPSSSSSGGTTPTPPAFPAFTPLKGTARASYTVHDFLTGEYRGNIYPAAGLTHDRRDGEAGGWSGFLPIANRKKADQLAEIIPRDPDDMSSGPGRLVIHSWREGVPVGIHWLHTAEIARTGRATLGIQIQGTTLDGYMNSVSLEEDVEFVGDQLQNARDFITLMASDPRSNPGFGLSAGMSGVVRSLVAKVADNTTYGRVLRDYARVDGGFGYVVNPTLVGNSLQRLVAFGSPKLHLPDEEFTFTETRNGPGEVTDWRELRSAIQGGTRIGVIGGTPQVEDATQDAVAVRTPLYETPHLLAGWPIIDLRVNHPSSSTDLTELEKYALRYKALSAGAPRVFSMNVLLGRGSDFNFNGIGGYVRAVMNNDWHVRTAQGGAFEMPPQRLIGWALTPAGRGSGKDKLQLVTAQEAA